MYYYLLYDATGDNVGALTCDTHLLSSEMQVEVTEAEYAKYISDHQTPVVVPDPEAISPYEVMQMIEGIL